jgi:hypothetical protein
MSNTSAQSALTVGSAIAADCRTSVNIKQLNKSALRGLSPMFDESAQLFCHRLKRDGLSMVREGVSPRYTAMTLMGLHRLESAGVTIPFDMQSIVDTLIDKSEWMDNIGDIGLLLWLCAVTFPDRLEKVVNQFDVKHVLDRLPEQNTMELAWFLAGLSHHALAPTGRLSNLTDQAVKTFHLLRQNQGERGIFGHSLRNRSLRGVLRGRVGSFADQIYPIYAMAKASLAYPIETAAERALDCALTICEAQGPQGQWWWHYDSGTGRVIGRYPIYSVHQHGMAPMGLIALGEALKSDFAPWIFKGLDWVAGGNELDEDVRDVETSVIWRCIQCNDYRRYLRSGYALLTNQEDRTLRSGLHLLYECRPYELGWLLYSFGSEGIQ